MSSAAIWRVALATPMKRLFDYLPPADETTEGAPGLRVRVPFGRSTRIGVVAAVAAGSELPRSRLKCVQE